MSELRGSLVSKFAKHLGPIEIVGGIALLVRLSNFPRICRTDSLQLTSYIVLNTIYNVWFHPLRRFPGPFFARAGRLWYVYQLMTGQVHSAIEKAHDKYGTRIRIAADELSFIDTNAWDEIYNFRHGKSELSKDLRTYEGILHGSVLISPKHRHGSVRKALSHGFSDKSLRAQEDVIRSYADRLIFKLQQHVGKESFNIVEYYNVSDKEPVTPALTMTRHSPSTS